MNYTQGQSKLLSLKYINSKYRFTCLTAVPPPFKPGVFIGEGVDPGDMGGDSLASETAMTNSSDFADV